jgi:hypothetical protein
MWSNEYFYFEIRFNQTYSHTINSTKLLAFLINEIHLVSDGTDSLIGNPKQPWMNLTIIKASKDGSFTSQNKCPEKVNLISIIGSKSNDFCKYEEILIKISQWLKWELIEEEDDDGNENVIIWSPK